MIRAHIIENNIVVNTIILDDLNQKPGSIDADLYGGGIGWSWDGIKLSPPIAPDITFEQIQTDIVFATQTYLNEFAKSRGYDDINSIAKYKDITDDEILSLTSDEKTLIIKFRTECRYLSVATAHTWASLYLIFDKIKNGIIPTPQKFDDIKPLLPELIWPV